MNYEEDIRIDETSLDVEWLEQPAKMLKYVKHAARMRMELDQAKESLDVVRAGLDKEIRTTPEKYGIEKVTEGAVSAAILLHPKYQNANGMYLETKYEYDIASGAVRAFEQRKDSLENLVRLHGQNYFAGPKIPRDLTWEREQKGISANEAVAGKMKRTQR